MDYTPKQPDNILRKYQWYVIHNPRLSLFGGAEEEVSEGEGNKIYLIKLCEQYIGLGNMCKDAPLKNDEIYTVKIDYKGYKLQFVSSEAKRTDFDNGGNYSPVDVSGKWNGNGTEIIKGDEIEGVSFILKEVSKKKNRKIEIFPTEPNVFKIEFFTDKANVKNPVSAVTIKIISGTTTEQKIYKIRNNTTQSIADNYDMKENETFEFEVVEKKVLQEWEIIIRLLTLIDISSLR
jgi:hypothetical protein